jgi:ATP-dependent RNA helicase SUPV3L1/SUV3
LYEPYGIAIVDEIQMIGNEERGAAWTNAILGLQAETIHLCGESRALSLVNKLCEFTNDELEERTYERYSKVYIEKNPFEISKLEEGDCLITFSTRSVHKIKNVLFSLI